MKTQNSKLKNQKGFTLIEVTVAVTLLALMTTILYGAFYLGHRAVEKAQARSEESQSVRSREDFLAAYIRSAYPCRYSVQDPSIFFSGEEDRLTFISTLSLGMGGRGMSKVTLTWTAEGDGSGFLTLEELLPLSVGCQENAEGYRNTVVLSEGIKDFRIGYLDPQGEDGNWVEQWEGKEKRILPRAVRFSLRGGGGEEIQWVFPVMMSVLAP